MLTALSLTLTIVFLIQAELWIKIVLVISSVPIALFANTLRIVIQCICFQFSKEYADIFHDYIAQFIVYPMYLACCTWSMSCYVTWSLMMFIKRCCQ